MRGGLFEMLLRVLDRIEEYLCAFLLLGMALLGFSNVVVRYLTSFSLAFSEEVLINFFVWISLLGAAIGVKRRAHLGVNLLVDRIPVRVRTWVIAFTYLCSIGLFWIVLEQGIALTRNHYLFGARSYSMDLPMWWFSIGVPIGAFFVLVRLVQAGWVEVREQLALASRPTGAGAGAVTGASPAGSGVGSSAGAGVGASGRVTEGGGPHGS